LIYPAVALTTDVNEIRLVKIETDFTNSDTLGTDKTFTVSAYLRTNADDGCGIVGYWKLDETSGTTAVDSSGKGNNGTLVNMESGDWVTGRINNALNFDGINERVNLPIGSVINLLTNCTIATWVNWSGSGNSWQRIWDFGTGTTYNMFLTPNNDSNNRLRFAITRTGSSGEQQTNATTPAVFPHDGWHHVAVTIDADNDIHSLYLDGILVGQNTSANLKPSDLGNTNRNYLGRSNYTADPYFNGLLDDVRIYNRVLTPEEIIPLANALRYRDFKDANTPSDTTSLTISTPDDTNEYDLLIAAVATDGDTSSSLQEPSGEGWTEINVDDYSGDGETPSVTHETGRQSLIGLVVNAASVSDPVGIIGSWEPDAIPPITHTKETGTNRALVFIVHAEGNTSGSVPALTSVTYGGQTMTKVVEKVNPSGSTRTYTAALILNNVGITAATTTTFTPTWSSTPASVTYSSVFLENVNQTTLTGATASNATSSGTTITTSALATSNGDMVIEAAACSATGTYTMDNGFIQDIDLSVFGYDGGGGHKSATGEVTLGAWWKLADASESASHQFTWTGNRQAYGWIMHFTGHDSGDPINNFETGNDTDDAPTSPLVNTDAGNCMILRLGAFDGGDITVGYPGLSVGGHTAITMDRSASVLFEDGFESNFNKWTDGGTTDWDRDNNPVHSGSYSAHAGRYDTYLTSDNINTSTYSSFVVAFWYRDRHINGSDNVNLQFYNGSSYNSIFNLGNSTEDQWNYYTVTVTDAQYCKSNFRIRFDAIGMSSSDQDLWIDDVTVSAVGGVSGGAGYVVQSTAGSSGQSNFSLNASNKARMITIAITPGILCHEACCGDLIKP
jgi:hypothetical protein